MAGEAGRVVGEAGRVVGEAEWCVEGSEWCVAEAGCVVVRWEGVCGTVGFCIRRAVRVRKGSVDYTTHL